MDSINEAIKEIAEKHGINIKRDDPILMMLTINERLMRESSAVQDKLLTGFEQRIEEGTKRWLDEIKREAQKSTEDALKTAQETIGRAAQATAEESAAAIQKVANRAAAPAKRLEQLAIMNLVAAFLVLLAVILLLTQ